MTADACPKCKSYLVWERRWMLDSATTSKACDDKWHDQPAPNEQQARREAWEAATDKPTPIADQIDFDRYPWSVCPAIVTHVVRGVLRELSEAKRERDAAQRSAHDNMHLYQSAEARAAELQAKLDLLDCTAREGGTAKHCRHDAPCLTCKFETLSQPAAECASFERLCSSNNYSIDERAWHWKTQAMRLEIERDQAHNAAIENGLSAIRGIAAVARPQIEAEARAAMAEQCATIAETPFTGEQDDITMQAKDRVAKAIRALAALPQTHQVISTDRLEALLECEKAVKEHLLAASKGDA